MTKATEKIDQLDWDTRLLKYFDIYGSGKQTSRTSFRLPSMTDRFFKLEDNPFGKCVSLMTRNFGVNSEMIAIKLNALGYTTRIKPKYLEIDVKSYDELLACLKLFIRSLPKHQQIEFFD